MKTKVSTEKRWWDLPAATLLIVALFTAASRLVTTEWTDQLEMARGLAVLGVIAGLALGKSIFRPRLAAFFAFVYGIFLIPWLLGREMDAEVLWGERLLSLGGRLQVITGQILGQEIVYDSLLFIILMAALFWILGVHAGYSLVRYGNAWQVVLPAGLALFIIHSFDAVITRRVWYLAVYLFFALVLVARLAFLQQHSRWQQSRTALPPHLGLDFIRFTLLAAAMIVLLSWTAPALANSLPAAARAFSPVRQAWNDARDRLDNAFASLRSTVGVVSDYYGDNLALGTGNKLTDLHMFTVDPPREVPANVRFYWRARVYHSYINGSWAGSTDIEEDFKPRSDEIVYSEYNERTAGTYVFYAATPVSTLYTPSHPAWVSRSSEVDIINNPDGSMDISSFRAQPPLYAGEAYETIGSFPSATVVQLRESGEEYPEWVTERYLQLPLGVTSRTKRLAEQITAGLDNPYDKAVAITAYLRENIEYSEIIPNQPRNQDLVDWFLFDLKIGFCEYYASAEVVMLRSLGIPARFVAGYAMGERTAEGDYIVRQRDAHTWPEVFFPGYGWVEFEPTSSQPAIVRRSGAPTDASNRPNEQDLIRNQLDRLEEELLREQREGDASGFQAQQTSNPWATVTLAGSILLGVLVVGFVSWKGAQAYFGWPALPILLVDFMARRNITPPQWLHLMAYRARQPKSTRPAGPPLAVRVERLLLRVGVRPPELILRWSHWASLPALQRSYGEINRALNRLGRPALITETPAERAATLSSELPPAAASSQRLVQEYQIETFGRQTADANAAVKAGQEIRSLSYRAAIGRRFQRLLQRVQKPKSTDKRL